MSESGFSPSDTSSMMRSMICLNRSVMSCDWPATEISLPRVYTGTPRWASISRRLLSLVPHKRARISASGTTIVYAESINLFFHSLAPLNSAGIQPDWGALFHSNGNSSSAQGSSMCLLFFRKYYTRVGFVQNHIFTARTQLWTTDCRSYTTTVLHYHLRLKHSADRFLIPAFCFGRTTDRKKRKAL